MKKEKYNKSIKNINLFTTGCEAVSDAISVGQVVLVAAPVRKKPIKFLNHQI